MKFKVHDKGVTNPKNLGSKKKKRQAEYETRKARKDIIKKLRYEMENGDFATSLRAARMLNRLESEGR